MPTMTDEEFEEYCKNTATTCSNMDVITQGFKGIYPGNPLYMTFKEQEQLKKLEEEKIDTN